MFRLLPSRSARPSFLPSPPPFSRPCYFPILLVGHEPMSDTRVPKTGAWTPSAGDSLPNADLQQAR